MFHLSSILRAIQSGKSVKWIRPMQVLKLRLEKVIFNSIEVVFSIGFSPKIGWFTGNCVVEILEVPTWWQPPGNTAFTPSQSRDH